MDGNSAPGTPLVQWSCTKSKQILELLNHFIYQAYGWQFSTRYTIRSL